MFRATCDKRVTTSAARQPTNSKPAHLEMPAGKPDVHQTRPRQSCALPHHPRQRLMATHHDSPFIGIANPCGTGRVLAVRQLATLELAARTLSAHSAARPPPIHRP